MTLHKSSEGIRDYTDMNKRVTEKSMTTLSGRGSINNKYSENVKHR